MSLFDDATVTVPVTVPMPKQNTLTKLSSALTSISSMVGAVGAAVSGQTPPLVIKPTTTGMVRQKDYTPFIAIGGVVLAGAGVLGYLWWKKRHRAVMANPQRRHRNPARLGGGGRMRTFVSKCVAGARRRGFRPHKYKTLEAFCKATGAKVGRAKWGKSRFQKLAAAGRRRKGGKVIRVGKFVHARRAAANPAGRPRGFTKLRGRARKIMEGMKRTDALRRSGKYGVGSGYRGRKAGRLPRGFTRLKGHAANPRRRRN